MTSSDRQTTASDGPGSDDSLHRLTGLTLEQARLLPERSAAEVAGLIARRVGLDAALQVLDALRSGEERLTLAALQVELLIDAGRYGEAVAVARACLERRESLSVRGHLVRALLNEGALDEAADIVAMLLDAEPERVTSLQSAGLVALKQRDLAAATAHFERLLELHPDSPTGLRGLARIAQAAGDADRALRLAVQAMDHYGDQRVPADLAREVARYAGRVADPTRSTEARQRAERVQAVHEAALAEREASLPVRLAEWLATGRARGAHGDETAQPERPERRERRERRTRHGTARREADVLPPIEEASALPAAPPPDPAAHEGLVAALREVFGYDAFRPGQEETVAAVLAGHDTLAVMPTGAGKSLCYQLPAFLREGVTLVISPLIALMKDQVESLPPALLAQTTLVNSTLESKELGLRLGEIAAGRYRLVYAAPERLRQRPFVHALARAGVRQVVIDEAHCLSMWGHDFRPDYLFVRRVLRDLGEPRVLAMTATATPAMMTEIAASLDRALCVVNTGVLRDNLFLIAQAADTEEHKLRLLLPFVQRQQRHGSGIVYVNSRDHAEKLERDLRRARVDARAYHAGMPLTARDALQNHFMNGEVRVMVATVAFGMGVDKADIRFIAHYNPPRSLEAYSQESGRAGRDGKPAVCLLLHTRGDRSNLKKWSREQAVDKDGLRAVYRSLRGLLGHGGNGSGIDGTGLVDAVELRDRLSYEGQSEVDLRVAISILENAGLLRRGPDVPRGATITLLRDSGPGPSSNLSLGPDPGPHPDPDPDPSFGPTATGALEPDSMEPGAPGDGALWDRFAHQARLDPHAVAGSSNGSGGPARPGASAPIDLVVVARELGMDAVALEDQLLTWQDERRLVYRPVGRDMLIELLPPPSDTAGRMDAILDGMAERNERRLRVLSAYLDTGHCRHAFIARHFGHDEPEGCRRCNVCRPITLEEWRPAEGERIDDPAEAVRRLVARCPLDYGRSGVVEVLQGAVTRRMHAERAGSLFGSLAHLSKGAITRVVDDLLAQGELVTEVRDDFAVLRSRQ